MNTYASLSDLKAALRVTDTVDDALISGALESASRWIDGWCDRTFYTAGTAVTDRDYTPADTYGTLFIDDAVEVVSVAIDDDLDGSFAVTLSPADWRAEPVNETTGGLVLPYNRLRPYEDGYWPVWRNLATVRVSARYGWLQTPNAVERACILQASRLFTRNDSPLGVAGFGDMGAMRVSRFVDPDVEMLLQPYRRIRYS